MDTNGLRYSQQGHRFSYGNGYSSQRRSIGHASQPPASLPYLPSLQRCVSTLEMSTRLLKSTVTSLDEATKDFPRLRTVTTHKKQFEFFLGQDMTNAQIEVARDAEPRLHELTNKAAEIIYGLESKEYELIEKVQAEEIKEKRRIERQKLARSGLSNIKKLQSLTRRKEELSRSCAEMEEALEQKRKEFSLLLEKDPKLNRLSAASSRRANKRKKLGHDSKELAQVEEDRRKEVARRQQDLEAIEQKIQDKRQIVNDLRTKKDARLEFSSSSPGNFQPTYLHNAFSAHHSALGIILDSTLQVDPTDKDSYEDAFARLSAAYQEELNPRQTQTDEELSRLMSSRTRKLIQMRNLCKLLFPTDSIGQTMVRVLEILVESPMNEVYHKDLIQEEFPPETERRHNLSRVVSILKQMGVIELMMETRVDAAGEGEGAEEELVLRINFTENQESQESQDQSS